MARVIWKGAISFGLVHIPVGLVSATSNQGIDFDWLDERTMDPVGYKRINKNTGKEMKKEHIVKGVQFEKGRYVIISEEEIRAAHPKSTQTIDIFGFLDSEHIPLPHIDTPYYLSPDKRGEKVYALLRETLTKTRKVALARVVIHTRQHLAALMPMDAILVLVLLRWPAEVRSLETIELGAAAVKPDLSKGELDMARRLVEDMSAGWEPDEYQDTFTEKIMQLVEKKARDGKIENVERGEAVEERKSADIIDLTELLKRSLGGKMIDKPTGKTTRTAKRASAKSSVSEKQAESDKQSESEQQSAPEKNATATKKSAEKKSTSAKKTASKTDAKKSSEKSAATKSGSAKSSTTKSSTTKSSTTKAKTAKSNAGTPKKTASKTNTKKADSPSASAPKRLKQAR